MSESLDPEDFADIAQNCRDILARFPAANVGAGPKGDPSEAARELKSAIAVAIADVSVKYNFDMNSPEECGHLGTLIASVAGAFGRNAGQGWFAHAAEAMAKTAEQPISVHHVDLTPAKKDLPS